MTKLDSRLNLVVPIESGDGTTSYAHSMPISADVFEENFLLISRSFTSLFSQQLNVRSGPRVAHLVLKQTATEMGIQDTSYRSLMAEIRRLTNIAIPSDSGFKTVPYQEAIDKRLLDRDDISEVEGAICFFILVSAMMKRSNRVAFLEMACDLWGTFITQLNITEYANSLKTSTADASSGETGTAQ